MSMPTPAPEWEGVLHGTAAQLATRVGEVSADIASRVAAEIPEAGTLESGLRRQLDQVAASMIDAVLSALTEPVPSDTVRPSPAALDLARRFGERGISSHYTVRVFQVGHRLLLRRMLEQIAAGLPEHAAVVKDVADLVDWNLAYLNALSAAAAHEHERAQALWARSASGAGARRIAHVLQQARDEVEATELLGYQVAGCHVGLVIWSPSSTVTNQTLAQVSTSLRASPSVGDLLIVPLDFATVLCWVQVAGPWSGVLGRLARAAAEQGDHVRIAAGEIGHGLAGFRRTHQQALAARRVAEMPGSSGSVLVRYRDVATTSLLAMHPEESGPWVAELLGPLADPGPEASRLRHTLLVFLENGENASNAAVRLNVHRNTVKHRVARALELLPVPFEPNRLNIAMALAYQDRAGPRAELPS